MKKCLKCGAELDDGANFCRYCGSSQKVDSAEAIAQGYLLCAKRNVSGLL